MKILLVIIALIAGWVVSTGKDKHQLVRLLDIFFYGPALLYLAWRTPSKPISYFLIMLGAPTITYNLRNYLQYERYGYYDT